MTRQAPNSIDTERALLGAMLVYEKSARTAMEEGLRVDDFYLKAHRDVFSVVEGLYKDGKMIDVMTVATKLKDLELLNSAGGMDYIIQLSDSSVSSASTKHYVEILQEKTYLRNLIYAAEEIASQGFQATDTDEVLDFAEKRILDVTRARRASEFKTSEEVVQNVLNDIYKMRNQKTAITGVKTGYNDFDRITAGLQRGDLLILAARPSMGKTAFALNLGLNVAHFNTKESVAIFSLEMPAEQLVRRMLAKKSMVHGSGIRTGNLNDDEMAKIVEASTEMQAMKIFIDDTPGVRVSEIFSKCRKLKAEHGLCLVVIDYIQLISGSGKNSDNRQQEVSEISRSLKALARELDVPVIALSQLSRSVEKREDKSPMLSDLRESGALEQDADIVMFLFRKAYYEKDENGNEPDSQLVDLNLAKHRNGATAGLKLNFVKSISGFFDVAEGYSDEI